MNMYLSKRKIFPIVFGFIFLTFLYFIYSIRVPLMDVLKPVFIALFISYLINPVVNFLEEKNLPRTVSILIIYSFTVAIMAMILIFFIPELVRSIRDLIKTLPEYFERYQVLFTEFVIRYRHSDLPDIAKEMLDKSITNGQQMLMDILKLSIAYLPGIFSLIADTVLGAVIGFYIIRDIDIFHKAVVSLFPKKHRDWIFGFIQDIDVVFSGFIRGQLLVAVILSILTSIGLWILGVKYAMILGLLAGLMDVIPFFGPILSAVPAVIITLIDNPVKVIWVILLNVFIQQIEGSILTPKIIGNRVGLHPVITIISVLIGGKFFGLIGMLLAVPVTAIIKVLARRIVRSIV